MPRRLYTDIKTTEERAERAGRSRVRKVSFVDPYPFIHGTLPEKMVYAELSRRGIQFYFLNDFRFKIPEIKFDKYYQADFMIPSLKLIIEVQGAYWHSTDKAVEADAFKFAIYQTLGYKVLAWWDFDIIGRLQELFAVEPLLVGATKFSQGTVSKELTPKRRTKVDTSKGIRTLNYKRGLRKAYKRPAVRQRFRKPKSIFS